MSTEYFEHRERALLGERYDALYAAPSESAARGVTVSALRTTPEAFAAQADFPVEPSPFCRAGFVVKDALFKLLDIPAISDITEEIIWHSLV